MRVDMLASIESEILERLKVIDPYKVILFGSYAHGNQNKDSDIDLYIVTKHDFIPQNYRENMDHYLEVSRILRDIKKNYSMDLIVHTLGMHKKFIELQSSFSREILTKGRVLYEADN